MNQPTLGLCIITAVYTRELSAKIDAISPYFDKIYIQVNGIADIPDYSKDDVLQFSTFRWTHDFSAARNVLLKEVKTDYWMWIDTDDTIEHPEALRDVVAKMESDGTDRMMALYRYAQNELGEEIAPHIRERIMRTSHPYRWFGRIHETITSDRRDEVSYTDDFAIVQHKTQEEFEASVKRNHAILLEEYKKKERDPRVTYYLGLSMFTQKHWEEAIALFVEHIRTSGSPSDQYDSWLKIAECHSKIASLDKALGAAIEAMRLIPARPSAYFVLAQLYFELQDFPRCIEWINVGMQKPELKTLAITDPTLRYRTIMLGALAEFQRGRVDDAWDLINMVLQLSPNYSMARKYLPMFEEAYLEKQAIAHTRWLMDYVKKDGNPAKVFEALPQRLSFDPRLSTERSKLYPPKMWPAKSIVFYCGAAGEPWGPDTIGKGIGGSEEAVIYLSRELAKQGWQVTVFCDREDAYTDQGFGVGITYRNRTLEPTVEWLPWHTFNPKDTFDVIVAWRNPGFFTEFEIKARVRAVDMHDTPMGHQSISESDAKAVHKFFFKSKMQRDVAKTVTDEQASIISNGIVESQFK